MRRFDRAIERVVARPRWGRSFDLVDGLVGLGVYALARLPRPWAKRLLAQLASAARAWFAQTLTLRTPGRGFAGFRAYGPDRVGRPRWYADPGFLTGTAGIALALLAATTDADPAWDRVLLLS